MGPAGDRLRRVIQVTTDDRSRVEEWAALVGENVPEEVGSRGDADDRVS